MAIQDVAPSEIPVGIPDEDPKVIELLEGTSPAVKDFKALQAAFLSNYNTGEDVVEGYRRRKADPSQDSGLNREAVDKAAIDNQELIEVYDEHLTETGGADFAETAHPLSQIMQYNRTQATDPQQQFVDAVSAPSVDQGVREEMANSVRLHEILTEATGKLTWLDYGMDFAKSLLPFRDTVNEAMLTGDVFGNIENVEKAIFAFKSKPKEWQQKMFPRFVEEIIGDIGPIRGVELLQDFIDPATTEDDLSDYSNWWKLIDGIDIASIGGTAALKLVKAKNAFNVPKLLAQGEDREQAAAATVSAMVDEEAAEVMNLDRVTAAGNAMPFDVSEADLAHTPNISTETLSAITKSFGVIDRATENIMEGQGYMRQGILHDKERAAAEDAMKAKLIAASHEGVTVSGKTDNTTTFSYKAKDEDGNLTDETYTLELTLNKVGMYDQSQLRAVSGYLDSPTVAFLGNARHDVDLAQITDGQVAKVYNDLIKLRSEAIKPIGNLNRPKNKKRMEQVDAVLAEGDRYLDPATGERGKVFSYDELTGNFGLDDAQVQAYYATNRVFNSLWSIRNQVKREEMIAFGLKKVKLLDEDVSFGKNFDVASDAKQSLVKSRVTTVYDSVDDITVNNISEEFLDEQYALGKTLVKLEDPYSVGEGRGKFTFVFVNNDRVGELPAQVLRRKVGYVPKIAKDGHWFVKEMGSEMINGSMSKPMALKTLRYFDNKAEADAYAKQMIDEAIEGGMSEAKAKAKYEALEDREQEIIATATGEFSQGSGGAYVGARSQDEVLFGGGEGVVGDTVSSFEALTRNISSVSRAVPINQWRLGLEQRWINTANKLLGTNIEKFGELPSNIESSRKGAFLNRMAEQIRDWQGFPSKEEQVYQNLTQRLHEWALGKDSDKLSAVTGWLRSVDPISASRAAAFHGLLGWGNISQLWVQSQGMAIAASLNIGKNLTKTLRNTTALTFLGEGAVKDSLRYKLAAKASGSDPVELETLHRLWERSGLQDSVLQTADHAAAMRGHGIAMSALSDAADKGLFFYRNGELLNRRMAFATAFDEYKTAKNGATIASVSDEDLRGILTRTNNLMLNMTKANRAQFQKGLASIPTQFFQVSAKATETALGLNGNFSKGERGRMVAGQLALYGAAGVPLINLTTNYLTEYLGISQKDIDNNPELVKAWNDGLWGWTTLAMFGVDAEVSKRGSLLRGVTEFVDRIMFDDSSLPEVMLGAFGSTGDRFLESFSRNIKPFTPGAWNPSTLNAAKVLASPVLESVSTWRNIEKAIFMETVGVIRDRRGNDVVERDFDFQEALAAAIGFQLSDETKIYTLQEREKAYNAVNTKIADIIIQRMNAASFKAATVGLSDEDLEEIGDSYNIILNKIEDPIRRRKIMQSVERRIKSDDKLTKATNSYLKKMYSDVTAGLSTIREGLTGSEVITLTPEDEE